MTENDLEISLAQATHPDGPWEFGHYIERYDGPASGDRSDDQLWTPLIYGEMTEAEALNLHTSSYSEGPSSPFRRSRVVRRAVSPWEVQS
ncbi:hypothetical protein [Gordonia sp. MMO-8]|uniref:hypothetical protein n=1 Tax=Gordonia sp. MMO-8 TaxID=3127886 RepID=UPI00301652B7